MLSLLSCCHGKNMVLFHHKDVGLHVRHYLFTFHVQYNRKSTVTQTGAMVKCSGGYPAQYILFYPLSALSSCSWALWNNEARQFIYRKTTVACTRLFTSRVRKIGPMEQRTARRNDKFTKKSKIQTVAEAKEIIAEETSENNGNLNTLNATELRIKL